MTDSDRSDQEASLSKDEIRELVDRLQSGDQSSESSGGLSLHTGDSGTTTSEPSGRTETQAAADCATEREDWPEYNGPTEHEFPLDEDRLRQYIYQKEDRRHYLPAYLLDPPEMDREFALRKFIGGCVFYTENFETIFSLIDGQPVYNEWEGGKQKLRAIFKEVKLNVDHRYGGGPDRWPGSKRPY